MHEIEIVPLLPGTSIIIMVKRRRQCAGRKADIWNCSVHAVASYVRFHSRDNRLKGDRRSRCSGSEVLWQANLEPRRSRDFRIWRARMLSRALIIATVMLLIGGSTAIPVRAENLEAGKSPSQIFAGTCSACHKGMRGLLKTVAPGSLPGFLRQHYTTSSEMAAMLSAYVLSNGATDTRPGGSLTKQGKDSKSEPKPAVATEQAEPRPGRRPRPGAPQDAGKPDADGLAAQQGEPRGEPGAHPGRNAKRLARPGADTPEAAKPAGEGQPPSAAAEETGPGGRPLSAKQKLSKRSKPGREEPPKNDAGTAKTEPAKDEPPKGETAKTETPKEVVPRDEGTKTGVVKPADEGKPDTAKIEATKPEGTGAEAPKPEAAKEAAKGEASRGETPLRADPVPAVTPAPKPSEGEAKPSQMATPALPAASEPSAAAPTQAAKPAPAAAEASAPPPAPVAPAGPPAPPISQ
jgi:hypothetical protein